MTLIVILNGPNLNLLGTREPDIYGEDSWDDVKERLNHIAADNGIEIEFFQSNHEGALVDYLQAVAGRADGLIINPGALTHYGLSLRDALSDTSLPIIEVHLSNIYAREEFRNKSVVAPIARGQISGLGWRGYIAALEIMAAGD